MRLSLRVVPVCGGGDGGSRMFKLMLTCLNRKLAQNKVFREYRSKVKRVQLLCHFRLGKMNTLQGDQLSLTSLSLIVCFLFVPSFLSLPFLPSLFTFFFPGPSFITHEPFPSFLLFVFFLFSSNFFSLPFVSAFPSHSFSFSLFLNFFLYASVFFMYSFFFPSFLLLILLHSDFFPHAFFL